ncbi:MAG: hypothetical protein EAX90_06310 [Candidatus Heimdallarchaeota archaeon]|nr:hypothetical protein [Candidatus Heimdallarchaeota archaeon]
MKNEKALLVSLPAIEKEETKKFLSESKVLKRIYISKKGVEKNTITLQEWTAGDENHLQKSRENHLRYDN